MSALSPIFMPAYAKINLTLDVLGKRDDGYHRLASVMQTIALHDTLRIAPNRSGTTTCHCDLNDIKSSENLALRAAQLLHAEFADAQAGVELEVHKVVPTQAGLGGGSSDAACVLNTLNALWRCDLAAAQLEALGAQLGSDVPFFVRGGTALIEGRGEVVTPLPDAELLWLVLAKPAIGVPTAQVFRALQSEGYTQGDDTATVVGAIRAGQPVPFEHMTNALEPGVVRAFPEVAAARAALLEAGAPVVRMSGSGPTLFAPFRQLSEAAAVAARAQAPGVTFWLTHTITRSRSIVLPAPH